MRAHSPRLLALALLLAAPSVAWAQSAVVSPFVGKSGVDSLQVLNITSLVSSEVDFSMSFDDVHQLEAMPQGMNVNCLSNTTCLSAVAKAHNADIVIAGSVAKVGEEFDIYMVNYSRSAGIVRKKSWKVPADPTRMADRMSSLVAELLTGKSSEQTKQEDDFSTLTDISTSDLMDDEEEFVFDDPEELQVGRRVATPELSDRDLDDFELLDAEESGRDAELSAQREREEQERADAERRREEEERARADAERRRREEQERARADAERRRREEEERARADAERRRREEEERARADAERRRREEEGRSRSAVADVEEEEFSFAPVSAEDMGLEFAPADDLITVEDAYDDGFEDFESFDTTSGGSSDDRGGRYVVEGGDDFDEFDFDDGDRSAAPLDLDEEGSISSSVRRQDQERRERESQEKARREAEERAQREREESSRYADLDDRPSRHENVGTISGAKNERQKVSVTARVGTSGFQDLQFLTYGGELAFAVGDSARIETGLEAFSVRRQFEAEDCDVDPDFEGTVMGCYRWNSILPFHVGARYQQSDKKVRPYIGGDLTLTPYTEDYKLAFGFRGRAGVDFVPTEVFGLNLNLSAGMMHGKQFELVMQDMSNTGLLWQVSAGTVFML